METSTTNPSTTDTTSTTQPTSSSTSTSTTTTTDTGTGSTGTSVDITPLLDKMEYHNEISLVQTGFLFAILVAMAFHLVLNGGFRK